MASMNNAVDLGKKEGGRRVPYYRICPNCGAYLDFGERCDCQDKETAPDAANIEGGQVEIGLPTNISTSILTKE